MFQNFSSVQKLRLEGLKKFLFLVFLNCILMLSYGWNNNKVTISSLHLSDNNPGLAKPHSSDDPSDVSSIDAIVNAIYQTISFHKGEEPNWDRFRALFSPGAPLIRITQDGVIKMDLEGFIVSFTERIRAGLIKSFREAEISRKTDAFGGMAQVFSSYVKTVNPDDSESSVRGINCIQLYYDGQRWWVSSLLWEDERADNRIPHKYLR